jgi:hypothetical protein
LLRAVPRFVFPEWLSELSDEEIREGIKELMVEASMDLVDAEPLSKTEAQGISLLAGSSDRGNQSGTGESIENR